MPELMGFKAIRVAKVATVLREPSEQQVKMVFKALRDGRAIKAMWASLEPMGLRAHKGIKGSLVTLVSMASRVLMVPQVLKEIREPKAIKVLKVSQGPLGQMEIKGLKVSKVLSETLVLTGPLEIKACRAL